MKLPLASGNIFPSSKENFIALQDYYFPHQKEETREKSLKFLVDENKFQLSFSLNQWEFGARLCRENNNFLNMLGFSDLSAARIYYLLMSLFFPVKDWDQLTSKSHRKRLIDFKKMVDHQPCLLNEVSDAGFTSCVYPKSTDNLMAILDFYFPEATEAERKLSIIHFQESAGSLGSIQIAAQFCNKNKEFFDIYGVSVIPSERIHEVIRAIFKPSYAWPPLEYERNGKRYEHLKEQFIEYLKKLSPTDYSL